jgi:AcrR family transcriptional regulator
MEERILNKARELFFSYGIRSVTMDDIAKEMGVSKKTIYQFYTDKNQIVEKVISELVAGHACKVNTFSKEADNAVQEVLLQTQAIIEIFQTVKPGVFFELQKYFPDTSRLVEGHKSDCVLRGIIKNLERGIAEGLYRDGLDIETIAHIRLIQLNSVLNLQDFPADKFTYKSILNQLTELYLYGITNTKGQQHISLAV